MSLGYLDEVADEVDLNDLLDEVAGAADVPNGRPPPLALEEAADEDALGLLEGVTRWNPAKHPRWPKGTPKAGQFMEVGEQFAWGGKTWEIAFMGHEAGGKLFAHEVGGPKHVGLQEFSVKDFGGMQTIAGVTASEPKKVKAGKGTDLTALTVPAYVDQNTHDPSLKLPKVPGSTVSADDWLGFGRADQENYMRLAETFGSYKPGQNKANVAKMMEEFDSTTKSAVANAYSSQHGSSTGTHFNFSGLLWKATDKIGLTNAEARRAKQRRALAEASAVVQWDLYNKTQSADLTVFHRDSSHQSGWWQQNFIGGDSAVMSGLSQSWKYAPGHLSHFGDTMFITPVAIRNVCMSNHSVQVASALGHSEGFYGELEIATPDQYFADDRSIVLSENKQLPNALQKWLAGLCGKPAGGHVARELRDFLKSGKIPPLPPAPAQIQMDGAGGKLWLDPPTDVGQQISTDHLGKPYDTPKGTVWDLDYADKTASGSPEPKPANQLGLQPGDFIEGMKMSRYVILDDPGDGAFPFKYAEIDKQGHWMGANKTFNFESGGVKTFKKLKGHAVLPTPKVEGDTGPLWDPAAWAYGADSFFTTALPKGSVFKVNEHPYEVQGPAPGGYVQIKSLETGKLGKINPDYKATPMVPQEGYVAPTAEALAAKTKAKVGVTFAYQGEKYEITVLLKSGQIQAKRSKGPGVIKLNTEDPALDPANLHDPEAWEMDTSEMALKDMPVGQRFQGGAGVMTQKPYVLLGPDEEHKGKVLVKNLDTGEQGSMSAKKKWRRLVAAGPKHEDGAPPQADQHVAEHWQKAGTSDALANLKIGDKFVLNLSALGGAPGPSENQGAMDAYHFEVIGEPEAGDTGSVVPAKMLTGGDAGTVSKLPVSTGIWQLQPMPGVGAPITGFIPPLYVNGPTMKVGDMPEGTVFESAKGVPYMLKKKGPKSGAVAVNLLTGKPWPAIKYEKEFATRKAKSDTTVPYGDLTDGDVTTLGTLKMGDQFKGPAGNIFQVVATAKGEGQGPKVAEVTSQGMINGAPSTSGSLQVYFHAKAGEGYDPTKLPEPPPALDGDSPEPEPEPGSDVPFDAVSAGGFVPYKSSAGPGGAYKHHMIKQMAPGTGFQDKNGKLWIVKQSGASPIISDGKQNYVVDGKLRGRSEGLPPLTQKALQALSATDSGGAVGYAAGDDEQKLAEVQLVKNAAGVKYSDLSVGDYVKRTYVTVALKVVSKDDAHGVVTLKKADGSLVTVDGAKYPEYIAVMNAPSPKPSLGKNGPGLSGSAPDGALTLTDLQPGDEVKFGVSGPVMKVVDEGWGPGDAYVTLQHPDGKNEDYPAGYVPDWVPMAKPPSEAVKDQKFPFAPGQWVMSADGKQWEVKSHPMPHQVVIMREVPGGGPPEMMTVDVSTLTPIDGGDKPSKDGNLVKASALKAGDSFNYEGGAFEVISASKSPGGTVLAMDDVGETGLISVDALVEPVPKTAMVTTGSLGVGDKFQYQGVSYEVMAKATSTSKMWAEDEKGLADTFGPNTMVEPLGGPYIMKDVTLDVPAGFSAVGGPAPAGFFMKGEQFAYGGHIYTVKEPVPLGQDSDSDLSVVNEDGGEEQFQGGILVQQVSGGGQADFQDIGLKYLQVGDKFHVAGEPGITYEMTGTGTGDVIPVVDDQGVPGELYTWTVVSPVSKAEPKPKSIAGFNGDDYMPALKAMPVAGLNQGDYYSDAYGVPHKVLKIGDSMVSVQNMDDGGVGAVPYETTVTPLMLKGQAKAVPKEGGWVSVPDKSGKQIHVGDTVKAMSGKQHVVSALDGGDGVVFADGGSVYSNTVTKVSGPTEKPGLKAGDPVLPSQAVPGMVFRVESTGKAMEVLAVAPGEFDGETTLTLKNPSGMTGDIVVSDAGIQASTKWTVLKMPGGPAPPKAGDLEVGGYFKWGAANEDKPALYIVKSKGSMGEIVASRVAGSHAHPDDLMLSEDDPVEPADSPHYYNEGDQVIYKDQVWNVTGHAGTGSILKLAAAGSGGQNTTAVGQANVEPKGPDWKPPEPKPANFIANAHGTFHEGDKVMFSAFAGTKGAPTDMVGTLSKVGPSFAAVTVEGHELPLLPAHDDLRPVPKLPEHTEIVFGGYVSYVGKDGYVHTGTVTSEPTPAGILTIQPEGNPGGLAISDEQLLTYTHPLLTGGGEPKPAKGPGDFVLPSDLKVGDFMEVVSHGPKHGESYEVMEGPPNLKLKNIETGEILKGAWNDNVVKVGAVAGDASPWKLIDPPSSVSAQHGKPPPGAQWAANIHDGALIKITEGGGGPTFRVLHQAEKGDIYVEDIETGKQNVLVGSVGQKPIHYFVIDVKPGQTPVDAIKAWDHEQFVKSGKIPKDAPMGALPGDTSFQIYPEVEPATTLPNADVLEKQIQQVLDKYGGSDNVPVKEESGYKSEWGSGGQYRHRPLGYVPTGAMLYLKSGGEWMKLGTINGFPLLVNVYTGDAKVVKGNILVKPPKGMSWKASPWDGT